MKIKGLEERTKCIGALSRWFESQDIEPGTSMVIMMELTAILLGITAPNAAELEKALEAFKQDARGIAFRSYAENHNA